MRRQTLGTVNNGNQSRPSTTGRERKSLGARARPPPSSSGTRTSFGTSSGRTSFGNGRPSTSGANARGAGGRMSLAGNSRRSSQYGREGGHSQVKDTRPLTDKGYQLKCIRSLIEFLLEHNYPHTVSIKILSVPTNKCFIQVFQFLYRFIDPDDNVRVLIEKKPEEEVLKILKMLRYPFSISKSQLFNVGSPHSWPMILGALMFLLDLIKFAFVMSDHVEDVLFCVDNGTEYTGIYNRYLEKSYEEFMKGAELNELGSYDEEFYQAVRREDSAVSRQEIEQLSSTNTMLEEEFRRLSADSSRIETLTQQKTLLQTDKVKFAQYVEELTHHKKMMMTQKAKVESELEIARLENEAVIKEILALQETLGKQELSATDVERLKREKQDLSKQLEALEKENSELEQVIWQNEIDQAKVNSQVEKCVAEYTNIARTLRMIPQTAENSLGMNLTMEFNAHSYQNLSSDSTNIKPALLKVKEHVAAKKHHLEAQILIEEDRDEEINDQIIEKQDEISSLESKISLIERETERSKEIFSSEHKKLVLQLETSQKNIEELKLTSKNTKQETEEDLLDCQKSIKNKKIHLMFNEAVSGFDQRLAEMTKEKDDYRRFLMDACGKIINHKTKIQNRIAELKEETQRDLQHRRTMEVPRSEILDMYKGRLQEED